MQNRGSGPGFVRFRPVRLASALALLLGLGPDRVGEPGFEKGQHCRLFWLQLREIVAQLGLDFWAVADLAVADVGHHVLRLVPRREMAVPAVVTLTADVDAPRTAEILGLRFDVARAEVPSSVSGPA